VIEKKSLDIGSDDFPLLARGFPASSKIKKALQDIEDEVLMKFTHNKKRKIDNSQEKEVMPSKPDDTPCNTYQII
jgi:hypothetical protein